ncbi:uncharacterized protein LOC108470035 [Gossypium arboreum]|uniref:uncharacterized protein LOC108470035 n=1 Tax=Gossypium arboreum TaxID=29729 RepID=UPI0022F18EC6|nr:uncharacterized protein LOC108470035 [Gossypium arboreum]
MTSNILTIPISTVASESAFSTGGHVFNSFRSSLTLLMVKTLFCTQDWLRNLMMPSILKIMLMNFKPWKMTYPKYPKIKKIFQDYQRCLKHKKKLKLFYNGF